MGRERKERRKKGRGKEGRKEERGSEWERGRKKKRGGEKRRVYLGGMHPVCSSGTWTKTGHTDERRVETDGRRHCILKKESKSAAFSNTLEDF